MTETTDKPTVKCEICGEGVHIIKKHLEEAHPEVSVDDYRERYPEAPLYSEWALKKFREMKAKRRRQEMASERETEESELYKAFGMPASTKGVKTSSGKPIMIERFKEAPHGYENLVPDPDNAYVFNVDNLKMVMMGLKYRMNTYLVGHAGTGKSTLLEQACAHTNRPVLRIQHTVNTEEAHILGQYVVKGGETVWEPGPLQLCMKHGIAFLADEYDRAMPQVLSVYQPVLEGKALVTKEAPPEWRIIKPHPDFRFIATGNTNGAGDETGLYPSTALQDFANYERFALMIEIDWMPKNQEIQVIAAQAGVPKEHAESLVKYAADVRREFEAGGVSAPISPRALINAAKIGLRVGDYTTGLKLAFINRLGAVDKEACTQLAQRHFG